MILACETGREVSYMLRLSHADAVISLSYCSASLMAVSAGMWMKALDAEKQLKKGVCCWSGRWTRLAGWKSFVCAFVGNVIGRVAKNQ